MQYSTLPKRLFFRKPPQPGLPICVEFNLPRVTLQDSRSREYTVGRQRDLRRVALKIQYTPLPRTLC